MIYKIIGIHKDDGNYSDPDEAIDAYFYDGYNGYAYCKMRQDMVDCLEWGDTAYSHAEGCPDAECRVCISRRSGVKYLKTVPDGHSCNNLSSLPEYQIPVSMR